uniref:Phosphodiesterase n=2 Tax=Thermococcus aciditolerans TaxID=2598455 RepID=A0A5C0SQ43_9EURY|nr:phosphodiesterase [Thermococcus aciditolerans]
MDNNIKVAIIGLDGANANTARLIGLKNFEIETTLMSTIPPYTPPSWTSILTGVNPGKHGIIGWQKFNRDENTINLTTSRDVKFPRLTELLDRASYKTILINFPMTYPFSGIQNKNNSIIVSDWAAPTQTIYPRELHRKYEDYLVEPPHQWSKWEGNKKDYAKIVYEYTRTRLQIYYDLLEKEEWDLYSIVFSETDWFSHLYPQILEKKEKNIVTPTFQLINKFIEQAKEIADVVFIVSDHGFEIKKKVVHVNEILKRRGLIKYSRLKSTLVNLARKLPKPLVNKIVTSLNLQSSGMAYETNLTENKAFMIEPTVWGVYCKTKKDAEIVQMIFSNMPEIKKVLHSYEVFHGPYSKDMPDIILIPNKGVTFSQLFAREPIDNVYKGDHHPEGILYISGKDIAETPEFKKVVTVFDIAPTILHIFGLPIPDDMDGRVLTEIFEKDSEFTRRKPKYVDPSYYEKKRQDEKLKKAIKNLKLKGII